ncbi:MAG TPA: sugar isomerase domain-containing protein [Anaerolineales bacterium]|nr:sugar isomerase domain-containing protein [Anaerolineales bacterium]
MKYQPGDGIQRYFDEVTRLQQVVVESQKELLTEVAVKMAEIIRRKARIFLFGTGHSHMLCEEAYYRAGGVLCTVPLFQPMILQLHESARLSSMLERMPELAFPILDEYDPQPGEMLFVYADSGSNELPVQIAIEARRRGVIVVGVGSFKYAEIAPETVIGKKLFDVVDYAIDNHGVPGDALVEVESTGWRVAASSTITGATVWNCLLTEAVFCLHEAGEPLPITASFNMPGAAEHNQSLLQEWSKVNPHLPARNITLRRKADGE